MTRFYDVGSGKEKQVHICLTTNENRFQHRWATEADQKKYPKAYAIYIENLRIAEMDKKQQKIEKLNRQIINAHKQIRTLKKDIKRLENEKP